MHELELKLTVDDRFVGPSLTAGLTDVTGIEELSQLDLRATYYDTHDLRLARHGITLRYRTGEGESSGWTLKLPDVDQDASSRQELHFEGGEGTVPEGASDLTTAFARRAPLAPVTRLHTRRRRWCLRDSGGDELAELVDDRVSVLEHGQVVDRFRELELEARTLDRAGLERIASTLRGAGALTADAIPKAVRALGPRAALPPDIIPSARVLPSDPAAYAIQAALAHDAQRVQRNDPGARLGEEEAVHQMRVGVRRLRSDLRTFAPLVDSGWAARLRSELGWLGDVLGKVRDLDVMRERLRSAADDLDGAADPLFQLLDERHLLARGELLHALRSPRYVQLLDDLVRAAESPALDSRAWKPSAEVLPALAGTAWKKLARAARSLAPADPDERFHRVRILAKRSRYAAEAIGPALGSDRGKQAARFARALARIQDVLGELQDAVVAGKLVEEAATGPLGEPSFSLAAGRIVERQERLAQESKARFPKNWRKVDRAKRRAWLRS